MLLLLCVGVHAAPQWRVVRTEDGITISVRSVENSAIAETRGVMTLSGVTLSSVLALISDVAHQHEWVASMDESRVLAELGPVERINYTRSNAPWPVADRDAVVRSRLSYEREQGRVHIESHAEPDYIPEKAGVIRIRKVDSSWTLLRLSADEIEVRYQLHSEPGGSLPAWLINNIMYEQPYQTLLNLREQVKRAPYRDAHFDFLEDGVALRSLPAD